MAKLRILLADDHAVVRAGLKALINAQADMEVVAEVSDGESAYTQAHIYRPDLVIMDVSLPVLSGAEATALLTRIDPPIRVLALSVHEEAGYIQRLLEAGASGYVLKRSAADELITAVRNIAAGKVYLDPLAAGRLVGRLVGKDTPAAEARSGLSERERDVLQMIAQGYSNKEIAATMRISVKTVETYKSRAMEKLGLDGRVAIVRYAVTHGWLARHDQEVAVSGRS